MLTQFKIFSFQLLSSAKPYPYVYLSDDGTFYVVHTDKDENGPSYIITLGTRYINEKDSLNGKIVDELDLHSLIRHESSCEVHWELYCSILLSKPIIFRWSTFHRFLCIFQESTGTYSLNLIFDYVKKSRRERNYFFEDESQLKDFVQRIEPFIIARHLKVLKTGALQVLYSSAIHFMTFRMFRLGKSIAVIPSSV